MSTEVIYTRYITLRNGNRLYAHQKGIKAFAIKVRKKPDQPTLPGLDDEPKS